MMTVTASIYVWAEFFRHWTIEDVAKQAIEDPSEATPALNHDLAGKKVVVEGTQRNYTLWVLHEPTTERMCSSQFHG